MALLKSRSRYLKFFSDCYFCQRNKSYFHILSAILNKNTGDLDKGQKGLDAKTSCPDPNIQKSDLKTQDKSEEKIDPDQKALSLRPETMCTDLKTTKAEPKPLPDVAEAYSYYISTVCSKDKKNIDTKKCNLRQKKRNTSLKKPKLDLKTNDKKSESNTTTNNSALIPTASCPNLSDKETSCLRLQKLNPVSEKSQLSPNLQETKLAEEVKKPTPQKKSSIQKNAMSGLKAICINLSKPVSNKKQKKTSFKKVKADPIQKLIPKTDQKVEMPSIKIEEIVNPSTPTLRFIQFLRKNDNRKRLGVVSEDGTSLLEVSGSSCVSTNMCCFLRQNISMFEMKNKLSKLKKEQVSDDHKLLPPLRNPGKIICVDINKEKEPVFFCKLSSSLVGARDQIFSHKSVKELDCDVELAVVLGKRGKCVRPNNAMDYVFGYSIVQDITARDWQKGQFIFCRSMDSFCPLGPAIVHKSLIKDPYALNMRTFVNGEERHAASTKNMAMRIDEIICRISAIITIEPGDIIITNTPKIIAGKQKNVQYLKPGDCVQSEISCLGKLLNKVVIG